MHQCKSVLFTLISTLALSAYAQKSPMEELQQTSERIALLEAKLKEVELQNKLLQQNMEMNSKSATNDKKTFQVDGDVDYGLPNIVQVDGVKGSLEAVLVYAGNIKQRVREGDALYGTIVKKITLNEVVLLNTKTHALNRLQFGSAPVAKFDQQPQQQYQGPGSVPLPPPVMPKFK